VLRTTVPSTRPFIPSTLDGVNGNSGSLHGELLYTTATEVSMRIVITGTMLFVVAITEIILPGSIVGLIGGYAIQH
jgi:hypothetical protein